MRFRRLFSAGICALALSGGTIHAQSVILGANGQPCPAPQIVQPCPPQGMPQGIGQPSVIPPGRMPSVMPGQPGAAPSTTPGAAPSTTPGTTPPAAQAPQTPAPTSQDLYAGQQESGSSAAGQTVPQMVGDFVGYRALTFAQVPTTFTTTTFTTVFNSSTLQSSVIRSTHTSQSSPRTVILSEAVLARASGFKITDNESPQPRDRVFLTYNYFNDVRGIGGGSSSSTTSTVGNVTTVSTVSTATTPSTDVHREMFGFEKAFFDNNASIGLRVPILQTNGDGSIGSNGFGDLTIVSKYAFINNPETRNVLSSGLAITVPTGPTISTISGDISSVLFQPYAGYIYTMGSAYLQGFSSLVVPTNVHDTTLLFNDFGIGYIYNTNSDGILTAIIPTFETHVTTPLNNPVLSVPNIVDFTAGSHFLLGQRSLFTLGAATPITGPRPFSVEGFVQFNYLF